MSSIQVTAALFLCALAVQLNVNIVIEILGVSTVMDRVGFIPLFACATALFVNGLRERCINRIGLLFLAGFTTYLAVIVLLTGNNVLATVLIPKYGLMTWVVMGLGCHLSILHVAKLRRRFHGGSRSLSAFLPLAPCVVVLSTAMLMPDRQSLGAGYRPSYQFIASNSTVALLIGALALNYWHNPEGKASRWHFASHLCFFVVGTVLAFKTSLHNSMAIILSWAVVAWCAVFGLWKSVRWTRKVVLAGSISLAMYFYFDQSRIDDLFMYTRLRELTEGSLVVSSVTSRTDLFPLFFEQFKVDPILGDFGAPVKAGNYEGDFMHSLPLSLLTHTGMIGTSLFVMLLMQVFRRDPCRAIALNHVAHRQQQFVRRVHYAFLATASVSTFFTWPPIWFLLGFGLVRQGCGDRRGLCGVTQRHEPVQ